MSDSCENCGRISCYAITDPETGDWITQCELTGQAINPALHYL
ncbi:hypothetical protein [Nocardia farcinica]|nr:hypothetical protein [Nocardia farcinica]